MNNELNAVAVVETYHLRQNKAEWIVAGYREMIDPVDVPKWEERAASIIVTDASQLAEMKMARELRLSIRAIRTAVESKRKELKDDALQETKAIDGLGRVIRERLEAIEEQLREKEEFAKRLEEERERKRREEADRLLREKEERERAEREAAEAAERERMRVENERLRAEAAERERSIEEERRLAAEQRAAEDAARRAEEAKQEAIRREQMEREREQHRQEVEAARAEAARLAAMVKCPNCGHEFDSRGGAA